METIRYAQCWEDADVLVEALDVRQDHACLAIASAGDNALALLASSPRRVVAIDFNPAQIHCLELRVAAYRALDDEELLRFLGARQANDRPELYGRCRPQLSATAREFWDARPKSIARGIFSDGKFERYLAIFRAGILPYIEGDVAVAALLTPKTRVDRAEFFDRVWDTWRWRALFKLFFSRGVMASIGRHRSFFRYADADLSEHLLRRVRYALVELDPSQNPYLHWILKGEFGDVLPFSLRPHNAALIRQNLDRLSWDVCSLETALERSGDAIDRLALSDVFEYMSETQYERTLALIAARSSKQARLVYWNMLVPRFRPDSLAEVLIPDSLQSRRLHRNDKAFFYSRLVIEEVA